MKKIVADTFKTRGWDVDFDCSFNFSWIAKKVFQTYLYPKEASAFFVGSDGYNCSIIGNYYSEGRNIIEPRSVLIPITSSADEITRLVYKFVDDAEEAIKDSFLVRLLHR